MSNLVYLSWFGHNITLKLLLRWCVFNCTSVCTSRTIRRLQSIWYCCWYSMINYCDLCYRFLVSLKKHIHCNSCMMCTTNNISGWCIRSTTPTHTSTTVVTITYQPLQLIKTINIWCLQCIRLYLGLEIRYDIRFRLQQKILDDNNKRSYLIYEGCRLADTQLRDITHRICIWLALDGSIIPHWLDMRLYRCRALPSSIFELFLC